MPQKKMTRHGIVQSFNISPKGHYEGFLLQNGKEIIQLNFPPESSAAVAELASPGARIEVEAEQHDEPKPHAAHPVYRLLSVDKHRLDSPADRCFTGVVQQLNYSLGGEVNGALLDSGDFLHLKPHGAAALKLAIGMQIASTGSTKPMANGSRVIEAEEVNGTRLEPKPKPKKHAHA